MRFFGFWILAIVIFTQNISHALTLDEAFAAAKKNTSIISEKEFAEMIAEERKKQAQAQLFPTITATSNNTWRDQVVFGATDTYQRSTFLGLSQPVFQGGREYFGLEIANRNPEIARYDRITTEIRLYADVAQRYFEVLRLDNEHKTLSDQVTLLSRRLRELRNRARIGRSKPSDVFATEAQEARVSAELARLEARSIEAKQSLLAITGLETIDNLNTKPNTKTLVIDENWEKQIFESPLVKQQELSLENLKSEVDMAKANFLPQLRAGANYYLERPGAIAASDWELSLTATWQLYTGGNRRSEKQIQAIELMQAERELIDLKRNLVTEFNALKNEFQKQKEITTKLERAVELSRKNYQEHVREADQGLVNSLDVLRSLDEYLQIRRSLDQQLYDTKLTWIRLRTLAGVQP